MGQRGQRTHTTRAIAQGREVRALELRAAGLTYDAIAPQCGYRDRSAAYRAVRRALRRVLVEDAAQLRALECTRLDTLLRAVWPRALQGELGAVGMALRISERRCRLLGLDQADHVDITDRVRTIAAALGLDADAAVAEAERLVRERRYGG